MLATVEGVDMSSRILTLRRPDGIMEKVYAPADVTNLPQVRIGDQIIVSYVAVISAERATATDAPTAVVDKAIMRTPQGSKPGVAIGSSATTTVTVESYDPQTHTVTFTGPNGVTQTAELQRSQMQDLAATLKKGDQVQVTFSEAASLTIQRPAN